MTNCIMVQGTSSNAGKSMLVAALCRIYKNRGYKVAPFKSQNMSLNSYTTKENGEIGIAQMLQAEAAMVEPSIHMNPVLLKPKGDFTSNVIIQGKSIGDMDFYDYQHKYHDTALEAIKESFNILKEEYDVIIIEGAGSPAEINMRDQDIANMEIAHLADANVILIADIEMGGVFAAIAGTYVLLDDYDRSRLKATVINKFRGNLDILKPGLDRIEEITGEPVLGVLPYDETLKLPEEDSASLTTHSFAEDKDITIGVIRLPKIANFTDIDPFEYEDDVALKMIDINDNISDVDAIIIPGTRNSTEDMFELRKSGLADQIIKKADEIPIIGICGGLQILGNVIYDDEKRESKHGTVNGLGLLDIESEFSRADKIVTQSEATIPDNLDGIAGAIFKNIAGESITGYEIHEGTSELLSSKALLNVKKGQGNNDEGMIDGACNGNIFATYFHGIFHNYNFRREFLNYIRTKKGLEARYGEDPYETQKDYSLNRLAEIVEENLDMDIIDDLLFSK
ncbi:adenosylcobyric acid synthase (glutamine-hydrolysing) [Methanobrevibacter gottschalkii]|uniref:Probable cobyric acid synthase n=2 Tax=Methanobrevibacter gottschalkii TaxID=190974 RepID=A0A3N5B2D6_9EURY|nr:MULTISPECIES: cobyric acid synthase CobQ [Methanobrevibacter]MCQ2970003.1 cobyric acid synthase CobQ [archaeon]OEC98036.1 cobyric acid synthase CobQ [Methanobrevibacter sp. A27]RPF51776.1 adenosylcobyric acid synthase (glutamine-hydrolysing) [Methanobrevibacter gottschalkii DSM 11977]SEL39229.1 adenosylcobyric acid synthase (glutamine-hydrolysing) [Methanobrevibacter gottschalkii]